MTLYQAIESYYNKEFNNHRVLFNVDNQRSYILDVCSDSLINRTEAKSYCLLLDKVNLLENVINSNNPNSLIYKESYKDYINERFYYKLVNFMVNLFINKPCKSLLNKVRINYFGKEEYSNVIKKHNFYSLKIDEKEFKNHLNHLVKSLKVYGKSHNMLFHGFKISNNEIYALFIRK